MGLGFFNPKSQLAQAFACSKETEVMKLVRGGCYFSVNEGKGRGKTWSFSSIHRVTQTNVQISWSKLCTQNVSSLSPLSVHSTCVFVLGRPFIQNWMVSLGKKLDLFDLWFKYKTIWSTQNIAWNPGNKLGRNIRAWLGADKLFKKYSVFGPLYGIKMKQIFEFSWEE